MYLYRKTVKIQKTAICWLIKGQFQRFKCLLILENYTDFEYVIYFFIICKQRKENRDRFCFCHNTNGGEFGITISQFNIGTSHLI
jgi:hypothetical protein